MNCPRILLVGEQQRLLDALVEGLHARWTSVEVATAVDFRAALALAIRLPPDLVLIDLPSAQPTAWSLIAAIRQLRSVPMVVFASGGEEMDRARASESGARLFWHTPFSARSLLSMAGEVLRDGPATPSAPVVTGAIGTPLIQPIAVELGQNDAAPNGRGP